MVFLTRSDTFSDAKCALGIKFYSGESLIFDAKTKSVLMKIVLDNQLFHNGLQKKGYSDYENYTTFFSQVFMRLHIIKNYAWYIVCNCYGDKKNYAFPTIKLQHAYYTKNYTKTAYTFGLNVSRDIRFPKFTVWPIC